MSTRYPWGWAVSDCNRNLAPPDSCDDESEFDHMIHGIVTRRQLLRGGFAGLAAAVVGTASCGVRPPNHDARPSTRSAQWPPSNAPTTRPVSLARYGLSDSTSDSTSVFQRAIDDVSRKGGGVVMVPEGTWHCNELVLKSNVYLSGAAGRTTLAPSHRNSMWLRTAPGVKRAGLADLILDTKGLVSDTAIRLGDGGQQIQFIRCSLLVSGGRRPTGIATNGLIRQLAVQTCTFDGPQTCVSLGHEAADILVSDCVFRNWVERGIWIRGTAEGAAQSVTFSGNSIYAPTGHGRVRQPIQINGVDSNLIKTVRITGNRVFGTGTDRLDPRNPGTADLISLQRCSDFEVSDNVCVDGGEVGITVSLQSTRGIVKGNQCIRNGSAGIDIGSKHSRYVSDVKVIDNVCYDNGRRGVGDQTPARARAGIIIQRGQRIQIMGNSCSNTAANRSQLFGIAVIGSRNTSLRSNSLRGNKVARYYTARG